MLCCCSSQLSNSSVRPFHTSAQSTKVQLCAVCLGSACSSRGLIALQSKTASQRRTAQTQQLAALSVHEHYSSTETQRL